MMPEAGGNSRSHLIRAFVRSILSHLLQSLVYSELVLAIRAAVLDVLASIEEEWKTTAWGHDTTTDSEKKSERSSFCFGLGDNLALAIGTYHSHWVRLE